MLLPPAKLASIAGSTLATGAVLFIAQRVWELKLWQLESHSLETLAVLVLPAALAYGGAGLILAAAWRQLLIAPSRARITMSLAAVFYGKTQVNKYLPGNVFHYLSRQMYCSRLTLSQTTMGCLSLQEVMVSVSAAALLGIPALFINVHLLASWPMTVGNDWVKAVTVVSIGLLALFVVAYGIKVACISIPYRMGVAAQLHWIGMVRSTSLYVLFFIACGLIFFYLLSFVNRPFESEPELVMLSDRLYVLSVVALAWLIGYVLPGISAGVGVRELVLLNLLSGRLEEQALLVAVLAYRITTILGDLLYFFGAVAWEILTARKLKVRK